LRQKNVTLLAGVPQGKDDAIINAITRAGRQRVEFLPETSGRSDEAASVTVSSATIFNFDVERYEEI
jgi:uncharacterized protein YaaQ